MGFGLGFGFGFGFRVGFGFNPKFGFGSGFGFVCRYRVRDVQVSISVLISVKAFFSGLVVM